MANFTVTGDWTALLPGARLDADVRFQQHGDSTLVAPDIRAAIVNGLLKRPSGVADVPLPAPDGGVVVTGIPGAYTVTFTGPLAKTNVAQLAKTHALSGGSTPDVAIATTNAGTPSSDEVQTVTITGGPTSGTFTLAFNGVPTTAIPFNATPQQVQAALQAIPGIGTGGARFYWATVNNVLLDGVAVTPRKFLFQAAAAGGVVDLDTLKRDLVAAVA